MRTQNFFSHCFRLWREQKHIVKNTKIGGDNIRDC